MDKIRCNAPQATGESIPSAFERAQRVFKKFADEAAILLRYVTQQRNAWRDVAVQSAKRIGSDARFIRLQADANRNLRAQNKKLREALMGKTVAYNRAAEAREHYQTALRAMLSGKLINTDSPEHVYLMRNDFVYRAAYERTFSPHNLRKYFK